MNKSTILLLAEPTLPQLAMLEPLGAQANIIAGDSANRFERAAADADVIFNWSASLELFREVFCMCPCLRWAHSRSAGLEKVLFPELSASQVTLTNGTGVFSPSLGEFALAAILYFAKDFRRMVRNQMAGVWEPFDILPVEGHTVGIVGYYTLLAMVLNVARSPVPANATPALAPLSDSEEEVRQVEKQFNEARARADTVTLNKILADGWTITHGDGSSDTKEKYLSDLRSGARKFDYVTQDEFSVRFYGDTAIAAGFTDSKVSYNGQPQGGRLRFTRVYEKRHGAWQMIVSHATRIQP